MACVTHAQVSVESRMTPGTVQCYQLVLATGHKHVQLTEGGKFLKESLSCIGASGLDRAISKSVLKVFVLMTFMVSLGLYGGIPNEKR